MTRKIDPADAPERYRKARERYMVLGECLTMAEAFRRRFSRNEAAQVAKPGYEKAFDEEMKRVQVLQEILRETREEYEACGRALGM